VTIRLRDGRQMRRRVDCSTGMPENPMSEAAVTAKFHSLASAAVGAATAAQVFDGAAALFEQDDVSTFAALLGAPRLRSS
jgi:hypothetical protein